MTDQLLELDQLDENKDYFSELVGEGKKYKDEKALAKAVAHGTSTIDLYKTRMDQMREDMLKLREDNLAKANLEDLIDQLSKKQNTNHELPPVKEEKPGMSADDLESLFETKLQQYELKKKSDENLNVVRAKLKEQLGDKAPEVLKQRTQELGLTDQEVSDLAKKSPTALLRVLGLEQQNNSNSFQSPPRSDKRTDNFAPTGEKKRTWSYYQELKKANPQLYYDPKIAVQMQKDAIEYGESFRDGNYYVRGLHEQ